MNKDTEQPQTTQVKHLPAKLVGAAVLMFGFGFALVPLYDVFCDITGINGKGFERKTATATEDIPPSVIQSATIKAPQQETSARSIQVQFIAQPQSGFSGDFYPKSVTMSTKVNQAVTTAYIARNATDKELFLQAIPSISPAEAAIYVTKMECFCFQQQTLAAGQQREMGLTFSVSDELPEHIHKVTFSYSLYPVETDAKNQQAHVASDTPDAKDMITGGNHEPNT